MTNLSSSEITCNLGQTSIKESASDHLTHHERETHRKNAERRRSAFFYSIYLAGLNISFGNQVCFKSTKQEDGQEQESTYDAQTMQNDPIITINLLKSCSIDPNLTAIFPRVFSSSALGNLSQ